MAALWAAVIKSTREQGSGAGRPQLCTARCRHAPSEAGNPAGSTQGPAVPWEREPGFLPDLGTLCQEGCCHGVLWLARNWPACNEGTVQCSPAACAGETCVAPATRDTTPNKPRSPTPRLSVLVLQKHQVLALPGALGGALAMFVL